MYLKTIPETHLLFIPWILSALCFQVIPKGMSWPQSHSQGTEWPQGSQCWGCAGPGSGHLAHPTQPHSARDNNGNRDFPGSRGWLWSCDISNEHVSQASASIQPCVSCCLPRAAKPSQRWFISLEHFRGYIPAPNLEPPVLFWWQQTKERKSLFDYFFPLYVLLCK